MGRKTCRLPTQNTAVAQAYFIDHDIFWSPETMTWFGARVSGSLYPTNTYPFPQGPAVFTTNRSSSPVRPLKLGLRQRSDVRRVLMSKPKIRCVYSLLIVNIRGLTRSLTLAHEHHDTVSLRSPPLYLTKKGYCL